MGLIETLAWAVVELQSARPDMAAVRAALDKAVIEAAKLDIQHDVMATNLMRLAAAMGGN